MYICGEICVDLVGVEYLLYDFGKSKCCFGSLFFYVHRRIFHWKILIVNPAVGSSQSRSILLLIVDFNIFNLIFMVSISIRVLYYSKIIWMNF